MQYPKFDLIELMIAIAWLLIFVIIAHFVRANNAHKPEYKYYLPNFYFKIGMATLFALIYFFYYHGGDTIAYWSGSTNLSRLFYDSPTNYVKEFLDNSNHEIIPNYYHKASIGKPPIWIYREPNSWFICKIASIFSIITFESYLAITLFFGFISACISWRFFIFLNQFLNLKTSYLALTFLFIPTVGFWCSGLIKDTVVWWGILLLTQSIFSFFKHEFTRQNIFFFLISIYLIISIRPFVFLAIAVPTTIILVFRINKDKSFITKFITRLFGVSFSLSLIVLYFALPSLFGEFSSDKLLETAEIIQSDFAQNTLYTGAKYDIGLNDFETKSLIKATPMAIITSVYRPFIWEVRGPIMVMNGIESLILMVLSLQLFRKKRMEVLPQNIYQKEFIFFALCFAIILGYFVGVTSGIFGVLARLKAPVIPFFLVFVFARIQTRKKIE